MPLVRTGPATLLAVLSGVLMWLAFPPVSFGPYAVASIAALSTALWRASWRRGLGLGLVAGVVFFSLLLSWMTVIGWDAWLALTLLCAAWFALAGLGTALVSRLPGAPVWIASVWVLSETLRGRVPFGGFPWGQLSFAQVETPWTSFAPLGGSALTSFVVAFLGAAIVTLALDYRAGRRWLALGWLVACLALTLVPPVIRLPIAGDTVGGAPFTVVAIVQGGTPQYGMGAMDVRRAVLDNHVAQTLDLAKAIDQGKVARPAFVLWPENSSDLDPFADASAAAAISTAARAVQVPILVGAVISAPNNPNGVWNVGIVWDPETGPQQMYVKNHPVPFGEYIPFRDFLAQHIARFDRVPRDFIAGTKPGNLDIAGVDVGNVICFEIAYRDVVDAVVDGGARMLAVQTNNATYGGTQQPAQQLQIERLRAIEFGRSVAVAATSGISAIVEPDGRLVTQIPEGEVGWRVVDLPLRGQRTPATSFGHSVELVLAVVGAAAMLLVLAWSAASRRRPIA